MALWCKLFMRFLILAFGIFKLFNFSIECLCMAPLTPVVMVMRGLVFHPLFCMALISRSYLICFCVMACSGNLTRSNIIFTRIGVLIIMGSCLIFPPSEVIKDEELSREGSWSMCKLFVSWFLNACNDPKGKVFSQKFPTM